MDLRYHEERKKEGQGSTLLHPTHPFCCYHCAALSFILATAVHLLETVSNLETISNTLLGSAGILFGQLWRCSRKWTLAMFLPTARSSPGRLHWSTRDRKQGSSRYPTQAANPLPSSPTRALYHPTVCKWSRLVCRETGNRHEVWKLMQEWAETVLRTVFI